MPLYQCAALQGLTTEEQRARIAEECLRVHCDVTGALPQFVHSFFQEASADELPVGKIAFILGTIRWGRTDAQKRQIHDEMTEVLVRVLGCRVDEVDVATVDIPSKWTMEDGELLPEPGEEAAWAERHRHAD